MSKSLNELVRHYQFALQEFLADSHEAGLRRAYELGRQAIAQGFGLLDLAHAHHETLQRLVGTTEPAENAEELIARASLFFAECVSPFEMSQRGYRDTITMLQRVNAMLEREVDERKRTEDHLQRTLKEMDRFFALSWDMISVTDFEGYTRRVNPALERTLGFSAEELVGRPGLKMIHRADRARAAAHLQSLAGGGRLSSFECRILCKDGSYKWTEWTAAPSPEEQLVYAAGRDITDRKRAEEEQTRLLQEQAAREAAEEQQRRLAFLAEASKVLSSSLDYGTTLGSVARLAVEQMSDWCAVYQVEDDGRLRLVEVAHKDPHQAMLGRELILRNPPDLQLHHGVAKVARTGKPDMLPEIPPEVVRQRVRNQADLQLIDRLGLRSFMAVPLRSREKTVGVMAFVSAESAKKYGASDLALAEELAHHAGMAIDNARLYATAESERAKFEEANRAKDEFLATLSHELRTPLTSMMAWIHLLKNEGLEAPAAERALESIERSAEAQAEMVRHLLDVSRLTMGKIRLNVEPIEIAPVIEAALDAVHVSAEAKQIRLDTNLKDKGYVVLGDSSRLQQVMWNLLSNAIKFTPRRGRVEVKVSRDDSEICISISDTGRGISPDFLPRVFDRFSQEKPTGSQSGLGLGLAIVRSIVQLHGGTVQAVSEGEGKGACFTVRLPAHRKLNGTNNRKTGRAAQRD